MLANCLLFFFASQKKKKRTTVLEEDMGLEWVGGDSEFLGFEDGFFSTPGMSRFGVGGGGPGLTGSVAYLVLGRCIL